VQTRREILFQVGHRLANVTRKVECVGIGRLEYRNRDGVLVAQQTPYRVLLRADLDARHVSEVHHFALRARLDDDVTELLLIRKPPRRIDGQLKLTVLRRGSTDLPRRDLHVLLSYGADYVSGGQI